MTELRQRDPRQEDPGYLAFLRRKPCCVCAAPPRSHAAHVRMTCLERGKEYTGKAQKPHDRWAVPLCHGCHQDDDDAQHRGSEREFWRRAGLDPFALAERLYAQYCRRAARTPEQRRRTIARAKRIKAARPRKNRVDPRTKTKASFPEGRSQWPAKGTRKMRSKKP